MITREPVRTKKTLATQAQPASYRKKHAMPAHLARREAEAAGEDAAVARREDHEQGRAAGDV
jgi:hypothetical protein